MKNKILFTALLFTLLFLSATNSFAQGASNEVPSPEATKQKNIKSIKAAFHSIWGFDADEQIVNKTLNFYFENLPPDKALNNFRFWNYSEMRSTEISLKLVIARAYKESMGRPSNKAEADFWTPQLKTFDDIVEANRAFLYSDKGAKDLRETVARALKDKSGKQPTPTEVDEATKKYRKNKNIYSEM